mmetsp:Transcript_29002/g.76664  ORF Transcript_29002/g.76664 Transcript_29002/m.76664 type:complete len:537 (-) Transcript_29002:17-1627(-)
MPAEDERRGCELPRFGMQDGAHQRADQAAHERQLVRRFKRLYPLQPVSCIVPTLYDKTTGEPFGPLQYSPTCMAVLSALANPQGRYWSGSWDCTAWQRERLLLAIGGAPGIHGTRVKLESIIAFGQDEDNREMVHKMPGASHGLLAEEVVRAAFALYDVDGSGTLDRSEWSRFMAMLEQVQVRSLLRDALLQNRAFFGRRYKWELPNTALNHHDLMEAAGEIRKAAECEGSWFIGLGQKKEYRKYVPDILQLPGDDAEAVDSWADWWSDLYYYSANNHALHGIFSCDPASRLSSFERLSMEVGNIGFLCLLELLRYRWVTLEEAPFLFLLNPRLFQFFVVTIPGMIYFRVCYKLFTCSCGIVHAEASNSARQKGKIYTTLGAAMGYSLVAAGILALIWVHHQCSGGEVLTTTVQPSSPWDVPPPSVPIPYTAYHSCLHSCYIPVLLARLYGYLLSWLLMMMITFNPSAAFGQPDPTHDPIWIAEIIGLGQWTIEKQRFQMHCLNAALPGGVTRLEDPERSCAPARSCAPLMGGHDR